MHLTVSPVNGRVESDNATIHSGRFLGRVSVRTVVFQHSTGEQVSLYRPSTRKHICFRFITSQPLCQIKQGDQTPRKFN